MTEQQFLSAIKYGRACKDDLEEAFAEYFRSLGLHDAARSMSATFDGLIDDGSADGEPPGDVAYEEACNVIEAIEKAANGDGTEAERLAGIETIIEKWNGEP